MQRNIAKFPRFARQNQRNERGVALITTLLLLLLVTAMTLAMVLAVNADMLINGYYRNFRGSFYAADSGLNIVRQEFYNKLKDQAPATLTPGTLPLDAAAVDVVRTYINMNYAGDYIAATGTGATISSWRERYKIDTLTASPSDPSYLTYDGCVTTPSRLACSSPLPTNETGYRYTYRYSLTARGRSQGTENAVLVDRGTLTIVAELAPAAGVTTSFAAWGMFIDENTVCGNPYVPGTINGPVFTNGGWTFGNSGTYIFTDSVGQHESNFGYDFDTRCKQSSALTCKGPGTSNSCNNGNSTIHPTFEVTPKLGQDKIPLPSNDFNQKLAVVDGKGDATGLTNSQVRDKMEDSLKKRNGTAYGGNSGVYTSYSTSSSDCGAVAPPCMKGGGIYVEGNAQVKLSIPTGTGASTTQQIYEITQGSSTTTITVDTGANTTKITDSGGTLTVNGIPMQYDPVTNAGVRDATMLYVNGDITSLKGPGQGKPGIQDGTALTVTAVGDVTVTGDILYKTSPVTKSANEIPGSPADTLIPGSDNGQVLGIYTNKGDIIMKAPCNNCDLEVDASLATISENGSGGLKIGCDTAPNCSGQNKIDTLTILGGRINNQAYSTSLLNTRNVLFDRRFSMGGFAPPWFPSTTITSSGVFAPTLSPTFQRTQWQNRTSYY